MQAEHAARRIWIGRPCGDRNRQEVRQIRSHGMDAKSLPAIALTAFAGKTHARSSLLAGFQMHLSKPADPVDLIAAVASLAGRTGVGRGDAQIGPG